jgi:hypothetical protein
MDLNPLAIVVSAVAAVVMRVWYARFGAILIVAGKGNAVPLAQAPVHKGPCRPGGNHGKH